MDRYERKGKTQGEKVTCNEVKQKGVIMTKTTIAILQQGLNIKT